MVQKRILITLLLLWAVLPRLASGADFVVSDDFSDSLRSGGTGPEMVVIPEGSFNLGGGSPGDKAQGKVTIDYLLAVSTTEITRGQYRQFLKASLSGNLRDFAKKNENLPVTGVSFDEAEAYVTWLSRETGHHYRLPSASEWEYASRAGSTSAYSWGNAVGENRANCLNCGSEFTGQLAPVASFEANSWGLYDMHGNVWEWTKDCIDSNMAPPDNGMPTLFGNCDLRELRGGSSNSDAWSIRSGGRASALRTANTPDLGFRVVMDIPKQ
jgi:formylglycine-generating enzyme required for sulfatase activity